VCFQAQAVYQGHWHHSRIIIPPKGELKPFEASTALVQPRKFSPERKEKSDENYVGVKTVRSSYIQLDKYYYYYYY
jgi:hypothetical protein